MTSPRKPDRPAPGETLADAPRSALLIDAAIVTVDTGNADDAAEEMNAADAAAPGETGDTGDTDDSRERAEVTGKVRRQRPLRNGDIVDDRYVIVAHLGSGGMGSVHAAWDQKLGRRVALKLLHTGPFATAQHAVRLQREARALARVNDDHVVRVFDVGEWRGAPFLTMELIEGRDIVAFVEAQKPARETVVRLFMDAGRGLAAAHALGVVHRDVKGDNIFVGVDGRARIGDFGIATMAGESAPQSAALTTGDAFRLDRRVTAEGAVLGTPGYMAPEQLEGGAVDARCDQFSLCVAMWQAVFGEDPFPAKDSILARFERMQQAPATPQRRWPALEAVLSRGLHFKAPERYDDMEGLLRALESVLERPRRQAMRAAGAVVVVGAALGLVAAVQHDPCDLRAARHQLDGAVMAAGAPLVAAAVAPWLDRWSSTALAVCQRDDLDDVARAARLACFEARRSDTAALVGLVASRRVSDDAGLQAALALPPPETCLDERLRGSTDTARVAGLSEARMALAAGDLVAASTGAEAVLQAVRGDASRVLVADAALVAGQASLQRGAFNDAERLLREAVAAAMSAGLAHVEASAWTSLVEVVGDRLKRRDDALALMPFMQAAVSRFPDDVDLQVERLIAEAYMHNESGDKVEGAARAGEAIALALKRVPVNPHALGKATNLQALLLTMAGEPRRAVDVLQRGRDVMVGLLPPQHIRFAPLHNSLGIARRRVGDRAGARAAFSAAVDVVLAQPRPADHAAVHGVPLTNLAFLDLADGDLAGATEKASRARALLVGAVGEGAERVTWADDVLALAAAAGGHFDEARRHVSAWEHRYATREPLGRMHVRALIATATIDVEEAAAPDRASVLASVRARLAALTVTSEPARASLALGRAALALAAADVDEARRDLAAAEAAHLAWHGSAEERDLLAGLRALAETGDGSLVPSSLPAGRLVLTPIAP